MNSIFLPSPLLSKRSFSELENLSNKNNLHHILQIDQSIHSTNRLTDAVSTQNNLSYEIDLKSISQTTGYFGESIFKSPTPKTKKRKKMSVGKLKENFLKNHMEKLLKEFPDFIFLKKHFKIFFKKILFKIYICPREQAVFEIDSKNFIYVKIILIVISNGFLGEKNFKDPNLFSEETNKFAFKKNKISFKPDEKRKKIFRKFLKNLIETEDKEFNQKMNDFVMSKKDSDPVFFQTCFENKNQQYISLFKYLFKEIDNHDFDPKVLFKYFKKLSLKKIMEKKQNEVKPRNMKNEVYLKILKDEFLRKKYASFLTNIKSEFINSVNDIEKKIISFLPECEEFTIEELYSSLWNKRKNINRCHVLPNFNLKTISDQFLYDLNFEDKNFNIPAPKNKK